MKITIRFDTSHITDAQRAETLAAVKQLSDLREHLAKTLPEAVKRGAREGTANGRR